MRWHERIVLAGFVVMVVGVAWFVAAVIERPDVVGVLSFAAVMVGLGLLMTGEALRRREQP